MQKPPVTIETTYRVKPESGREPVIGSWAGVVAFAVFIGLRLLWVIAVRH